MFCHIWKLKIKPDIKIYVNKSNNSCFEKIIEILYKNQRSVYMYINNSFPHIYFMQTLTRISVLKYLCFLIQHKLTTQISAYIKLIRCDYPFKGIIMHLYCMLSTQTQSELCDRLNEECPPGLSLCRLKRAWS